MRRIFQGVGAALLVCLAVPAAAQDDAASWPACANEGGAHAIDARIAACAAIIAAGREKPENMALACNNRGWAWNDAKSFALALADLDRAIVLNPRLVWAWNNRSNSWGGRGDHRRAIADYEQAIRLDPTLIWPWRNRARSYEATRDFAHALADHREAVRLAPADAEARADLCRLLTATTPAAPETRRVCGPASR